MIRLPAVALLTWMFWACAPGPPSELGPGQDVASEQTSDFPALVPLMIREVLLRAPRVEPLMVDVQAFVAAARSLPNGQAVDSSAISTAIARGYLDVTTSDATIRRPGSQFEILHRGLHVSLDSIRSTERGYDAFVVYRYTDTRGESTAVGQTNLAIALVRGRQAWQVVSTRVLGVS